MNILADLPTMKKLFLYLLLVATVLTVHAIPARRGLWSIITLPDGTSVKVELVGNEHFHYLRAADGRCYQQDATGVYRQLSDLTALREKAIRTRSVARKVCYASTDDGLGQFGQSGLGAVNSIGSYTFSVIMVQFQDLSFKPTTTVEKMRRYYNAEGYSEERGCVGSVKDYFKAQSQGAFVPSFDVVGIVTLPNGYKHYGANDAQGSDKNVNGLVADAIAAAKSQLGIDFSQYDTGAGVPLVCILYAGKGEATEAQTAQNAYLVWPCEYDCEKTMSDTYFKSYFVGNELYTGGKTLMGMGVFCHEMGHALGLPDFYVTDGSYSDDDPFSNWSIMDCGAYVNDTRAPVGYTAYEKSYLGWLDIPELSAIEAEADGTITLGNPNEANTLSAVRIKVSKTEHFILESRAPGTWYPDTYADNQDTYTMGSGLMLSRIAYNRARWNDNTLNNLQTRKRACILTADKAPLSYSSSITNLYGNGIDSIVALPTYGGSSRAVSLKKITKRADGSITFVRETTTGGGEPTGTTGYYFRETFDNCADTGGNDNLWNGSIAKGLFKPDNEGWESTHAFGANQCAKFGTGTAAGVATTPAFTIDGEATTLTFKAAIWNTMKDGTSLTLSATGNLHIGTPNFTLKRGEWIECSTPISGSGEVRITFTATRRLFLDEVSVPKPVPSGIQGVRIRPTAKPDNRIYSLEGQYLGTELEVLPRGIYIRNGKKIVR